MIMAFLLLISLLVGWSQPVAAGVAGSAHYAGRADRVLVVKSERMLYLVRDNRVFASYRVALGRSPVGHKVFQGDGRTPEGLYILDRRNSGSRFYRSIRISYPSSRDHAEAYKYGEPPGGLVMIHGQAAESGTGYYGSRGWDWTEGCIAVSNAEMDEIWAATDEGTPIEILP
jgi:murein L,D-transpeptidase YafK